MGSQITPLAGAGENSTSIGAAGHLSELQSLPVLLLRLPEC